MADNEIADQPTPTSDAPPTAVERNKDDPSKAKIVAADLTPAEKVAVNERMAAMADLTLITAQQLSMLGITGGSPQDVLISTLYGQVRHMQAMFDALCDLVMTSQLLCSVPKPETPDDFVNATIGLSPVNRLNYFKCCTLKAQQQVSMIRRQMLSTGAGGGASILKRGS